MGKELGRQHQVGNLHPLVRPVEVGVKPGHGAAKGHAAGNLVDVGAAAGGQALALLPRVLLVPLQQRLHKGGVGGDVVGLLLLALEGEAALFKGGPGHILTVLTGGAQGHPGVKAAGESGLGDLQQGWRTGAPGSQSGR